MWLDNELSLFKQNIEMLRVNQRIGRLAYLWAVCGLMVSKFLAYLIFVLLIGIIQGTPLQGSQYLSYICFGSLQIIHIIGLFIPYINIFVSYHLLFKKSWHIDN